METLIIPTKTEVSAQWDSPADMSEKGKKRKISLIRCGMCDTEEARYRCPGCMTHSCSLVCVKKHKVETGCSGLRDKTAFVRLSEFDEINLLNDYRFLEETGRLADSTTRDVLTQHPHHNQRVHKLPKQASKAKITLKILPRSFTKRKENSTFFHNKEGRFYWHLKLHFPGSEADYTEKRVRDDQTLQAILRPYIHPTESDPVRRQKLKIYALSPEDHIRVFLKAEENRPNSLRYHELDLKKSLRENLEHKTIIEYPALHVALRDHCQDYLTQTQGHIWKPRSLTTTPSEGASAGPEEATAGPGLPGVDPHGSTTAVPTADQTHTPPVKRVKRAPLSEDELEDGEVLSDEEEKEGEVKQHGKDEVKDEEEEGEEKQNGKDEVKEEEEDGRIDGKANTANGIDGGTLIHSLNPPVEQDDRRKYEEEERGNGGKGSTVAGTDGETLVLGPDPGIKEEGCENLVSCLNPSEV
ncbi:box C/D snoRNA protein 1 [Engraulis encrasicolus]|uniref:box C/D snoRNA protein 1 n=1 Tax=Engraulis encrasicolus TaxID=184585 RepID=UPI002FD54AD0